MVLLTVDSRTRRLAAGFQFLEAPRWHLGQLFMSDFFARKVLSFDASRGVETVCEVAGRPSGLGFRPDGTMLVVSMLDKRLLSFASGNLIEIADLAAHAKGPANDMVVDAKGRAYVGNFGSDFYANEPEAATCLLRVDPDTSVHVLAEGLEFPNGMAITADQKTLLVAESLGCRITAFDLADDGLLHNRRCWASFEPRPASPTFTDALASGAVIPDGICLDADGALWVANSGGHEVLRIAEGGDILDRISCGSSTTYAVALGGEQGTSLFMCVGPKFATYDPETTRNGELWMANVDVPGLTSL